MLAARGLDAIERVFGSDVMPLATLRGAGFGVIDRLAPLKQFLAGVAGGNM
jgi:hypothetical protein